MAGDTAAAVLRGHGHFAVGFLVGLLAFLGGGGGVRGSDGGARLQHAFVVEEHLSGDVHSQSGGAHPSRDARRRLEADRRDFEYAVSLSRAPRPC